jgi:uncharacterized protein (TIGR03118 family)
MRARVIGAVTAAMMLFLACSGGNHEGADAASPNRVSVVNLISSEPSVLAAHYEPKLVDAWGLEFGHKGRIWVNNATGYSIAIDPSGAISLGRASEGDAFGKPMYVRCPNVEGDYDKDSGVTGAVFDENDSFSGDPWIFVSVEGVISSWNHPDALKTKLRVDKSADGSSYFGAALLKNGASRNLLVADFRNGRIDLFDTNFAPAKLLGDFIDPNMPSGYAPWNVKQLGNFVYVTYAQVEKVNAFPDPPEEKHAVGAGLVSVFNLDGTFARRFADGGVLNAPWGVAEVPLGWGAMSGLIMVGNFGDGAIHLFTKGGVYVGPLRKIDGQPLKIDGLWALTFGGNTFNTDQFAKLYFSAGQKKEKQGLVGRLDPIL